MNKTPAVYLAGPIDCVQPENEEARRWRTTAKAHLTNLCLFDPAMAFGGLAVEAPDYLEAVDGAAVRAADGVLAAIFPEIPSWGTPAEVWLAASLDIPVVLWTPDGLVPPYYQRFDAYVGLKDACRAVHAAAHEHRAKGRSAPIVWAISEGIQAPQMPGDAGYDMSAMYDHAIAPGERARIELGSGYIPLRVAIPPGMFCVPFVRSSLAAKGLLVAPTIIEQYRGPLYAFVFNTSNEAISIKAGDRIAQLVFFRLTTPEVYYTDGPLPSSDRGVNGFGSTGT